MRSLGDLMEVLQEQGRLTRVEAEVSAEFEVTEIARRLSRESGGGNAAPAVLFGSVRGSAVPLAVNLLADEKRIHAAFRVKTLDEVTARLERLLDPREPEGWFDRLKPSPHAAAMRNIAPREVRAGACQQVVRLGSDVDLGELPVPRHGPDEPRPVVTAATLVSVDPTSGEPISLRCPLVVAEADRLGVFWADDSSMARVWRIYRQRRESMPLAAVLGGDPLLPLATSMRLPEAIDVVRFVGLMREAPVEVVGCRSNALKVPAEAEVVVEGRLLPSHDPIEVGPVLGELGLYLPPRWVPSMHVTAITQRAQAVYPAIIPGVAEGEETAMRRAMMTILLPVARSSMPELIDYALPSWGGARQAAVVAIDKSHAGQGCRARHRSWSLPWLQAARFLVGTDGDVDPRDQAAVSWAVVANVDPGQDVVVHHGPSDPADPAWEIDRLTPRMAIDATTKLPGDRSGRAAVTPFRPDAETVRQVTSRWPELGLGDREEQ